MTASDARFVELYDRYYRHIYAYCRRRTRGDQVDDAVADTFLTAWRRIDTVPDGREGLLWLYKVAYRTLGHQWRGSKRKRRLVEKLSATGVNPTSGPEDVVVLNHEYRQVMEALSRLRPSDQEILRLAVWEGLGNAEISNVLGVSTAAAKQRLHRARRSLTREYKRLENRKFRSPAAQEGGKW
jgi:RNA polymerase sigma-70 factor (ECF subfamily)